MFGTDRPYKLEICFNPPQINFYFGFITFISDRM